MAGGTMTMDGRELAPKEANVSDTKHSPGPWKACTASSGKCACGTVWSIPRDMPVATAHHKSQEGEGDTPLEEMAANAALIAAAPEMLEVLRQAAAEVLPHEYGDLAEKAEAILDRLRGAGAIT